jgi:hypothetical protein
MVGALASLYTNLIVQRRIAMWDLESKGLVYNPMFKGLWLGSIIRWESVS